MLSKPLVLDALVDSLRGELDGLDVATAMARDEATHGESRPENRYDTRALEASYLAAGQGQRLAELRQLLAWVEQVPAAPCEVVRAGALVVVEDEQEHRRWLFIAPVGGATVEVSGEVVQVVSPRAALGRVLMGLSADEAGHSARHGERRVTRLG